MKRTEELKIPTHFAVVALLSSSLTLVVSIVYTVLSSVALALHYQCDEVQPDLVPGSGFFMSVLYRVYFLNDECAHKLLVDGVTQADTVFLLVVFTLVLSVLTLISAIALITVMSNEGIKKYISLVVYVYFGACAASFVIDLTFAIHFGMDYGVLNARLDISSSGFPANYMPDMARLSAIFLMSLSLKGFLYHAVNIALLTLLVIYTVEYQTIDKNNVHSIHKMGALNAYDQQNRRDDAWQPQSDIFLGLPRSHHSNPAFTNDDDLTPLPPPPRSPMRDTSMSDYSNNRFFDRSESWQAKSAQSGSRPFSYLGDANRPTYDGNRSTYLGDGNRSTYIGDGNRQMGMKPPPVPAPDYSPPTARRLKSALKPAYM